MAGGRPSNIKGYFEGDGYPPGMPGRLVRVMEWTTGLRVNDAGAIKNFAKLVGMQPTQLSRYMQGLQDPRDNTFLPIERATGYRMEWILKGEEPRQVMDPDNLIARLPDINGHSLLGIPLYKDTVPTLPQSGTPEHLDHLVLDLTRMPPEVRDPSRLYYLVAGGDDMEPTISPGDLLLVDPLQDQLDAGETPHVYLIEYDGKQYVRRLFNVTEALWFATTANGGTGTNIVLDRTGGIPWRILGRVIKVDRLLN
jgi:transcriptional regulator with XRE-family HTH domain